MLGDLGFEGQIGDYQADKKAEGFQVRGVVGGMKDLDSGLVRKGYVHVFLLAEGETSGTFS